VKRILLLSALMVLAGTAYGWVSAAQNQNPYDNRTDTRAWHWQPSAVWLPSYLLCQWPRNGIGITHTRSGWLFRSEAERDFYYTASALIGGGLGGGVAGILLLGRRCYSKKIPAVSGQNVSGI
jgi:hypothetical protein